MNTQTNRQSRSGSRNSRGRNSSFSSSRSRGGFKRGGSSSNRGGGSRGGSRSFGTRNRRSRSGGGGGRKNPTFDPSQFVNKNPVDAAPDTYTAKHTFKTFGLDEKIVKTITQMGITIPTPIQDQIIPEILNGRDVIGLAETGTGKTAAFLVPILEKTLKEPKRQTLILAPTRELAIQIDDELRKLSRGMRIFSVVCVGGMNIRPQISKLRYRNQFIIGTPGRVLDLMKRKNLKTDGITTVVLDEADRMLDMGFIGDMRTILAPISKDRETLFFSATMSKEAEGLVNDFLRDPVRISVKKKDVANSIEQDIVPYGHHNKFETLVDLLSDDEFSRIIIFGSMKHSVEKLSQELSRKGMRSESIHGNKSHGQRQRALKRLKEGKARILVATDVAARGIHVDDVSHVINYDLPNTFEDYVHRIGRTGRGSKRGKALTFVQAGASRRS